MQQVSAQVVQGFVALGALFVVLAPFFILMLVFVLPMCPKSSCDEYWKRFPYIVLQVLAIPAFFGAVTMAVLFKQAREYFIDHFDEYRCKPWFMPFVSFIKPDVSSTKNVQKCMSHSCGSVFAALTTPFLNVTESLGTGMNIANSNFEQVQRNHLHLGGDLMNVFGQSNQHMGKVQAMATYMFMKMKAVFDKLLAMVFDFYFALVTMLDMVNIMILMPQYFVVALFVNFTVFFSWFVIYLILSIIFLMLGIALFFVPFMQAPAEEAEEEGVEFNFVSNAFYLFLALVAFAFFSVLLSLSIDAQRASNHNHAAERRKHLQQKLEEHAERQSSPDSP